MSAHACTRPLQYPLPRTCLAPTPPTHSPTHSDSLPTFPPADLDFDTPPWPHISRGAKDLVRCMLQRNPAKRPTAHEVLKVGSTAPLGHAKRCGGFGGFGGAWASGAFCVRPGALLCSAAGFSRAPPAAAPGCCTPCQLVHEVAPLASAPHPSPPIPQPPHAQHPWLLRTAPDVQLDAVVITRMRNFAAMSKVKRAAMLVAAQGLTQVGTGVVGAGGQAGRGWWLGGKGGLVWLLALGCNSVLPLQ